VPATSITFVSQASIDSGVVKSYGLRKRVEAVKNCRNISKRDMKYNDVMPKMKVDPERYVSRRPITLAQTKSSRRSRRTACCARQSRRRPCP
jgi:urease alpha subunit